MYKKISMELLNKLASYLASKPYVEVFQLLQELGKLEDVNEKQEVSKIEK